MTEQEKIMKLAKWLNHPAVIPDEYGNWSVVEQEVHPDRQCEFTHVFNPLTNIADAWMLVMESAKREDEAWKRFVKWWRTPNIRLYFLSDQEFASAISAEFLFEVIK